MDYSCGVRISCSQARCFPVLICWVQNRFRKFSSKFARKFPAMKYFALLTILVLASCTSPREEMKERTDNLLKRSNQQVLSGSLQQPLIDSTFQAIEAFVSQFPADTLAPKYLFEKALLQEKQMQYLPAIETLDRIYSAYPDSPQGSKALFLQGYLYANVVNDYDQARIKYQLYLDNYAAVDPKITSDVKMELDNLGKTPDEILKEILEKAASDTTQIPV